MTENPFRAMVRQMMMSDPMMRHLSDAMVDKDKVLIKAMEIAAGEDQEEVAVLPSVDLKILNFINAMSPEEQRLYAEKGELPPAVFTRVNAKLKEGEGG